MVLLIIAAKYILSCTFSHFEMLLVTEIMNARHCTGLNVVYDLVININLLLYVNSVCFKINVSIVFTPNS